ncbi:hypothetical protein AVEN_189305-1, partial [Araneus ventricosus]
EVLNYASVHRAVVFRTFGVFFKEVQYHYGIFELWNIDTTLFSQIIMLFCEGFDLNSLFCNSCFVHLEEFTQPALESQMHMQQQRVLVKFRRLLHTLLRLQYTSEQEELESVLPRAWIFRESDIAFIAET